MYDPVTARFLQEDTYTGEYNDPLSLNLYTYCHNEPLMYTDPTGHIFEGLYKKAAEFGKKIVNTVKKVASTVKKTFTKAVNTVKKTVTKAVDTVKKTVRKAISKGKEFVKKNITEPIKNKLSPPKEERAKGVSVEEAGVGDIINNKLAFIRAEDGLWNQVFDETLPAKWFTENTQSGDLDGFLSAFGFNKDSNDIYHVEQDSWQKHWGYNNLYDFVFDTTTSMETKKIDFSVDDDEEYRLWLWKGDYTNLGAGVEAGIYYGGDPHWKSGTEYKMPMTLNLYDNNENKIFNWTPEENNWWITGFDPKYQDIRASNLTVHGTIDFSQDSQHQKMWDAFYEDFNDDPMWSFDEKHHICKL